MRLDYLAHHSELIPTIADWYFGEWGHLMPGDSREKTMERLAGYLHIDRIPLMVVALAEHQAVGVAQLKFHEMEIYPERRHWLGGVYVVEAFRGRRIAEHLIGRIVDEARRLHVETISLQTEHLSGGLYRRLGWRAVETVVDKGDKVLVMERGVEPLMNSRG